MTIMPIKRIRAPKYFRFKPEYASGIISFLRNIYKCGNERVVLDLASVVEMTEGDFIVLMAQIEKAYVDHRTYFYIDTRQLKYPIKKIIEKYLKEGEVSDKTRLLHFHKAATKGAVTMAMNINPTAIEDVMSDLKKVGIMEYFEPLRDLLVELLGNATEHGIMNKKINWWLYCAKNHNTKCMDFVFVDMGIGIIGSHKRARLPISYYFKKSLHVIKDAMDGILRSSTRKPGRGRGMQDIKRIVELGYLSNFVLITNKVALKYTGNQFEYFKTPDFIGTFFSWSISKYNVEVWKNIK